MNIKKTTIRIEDEEFKMVRVDSPFGRKIGLTSDRFDEASYILKKGDDIILSYVREKSFDDYFFSDSIDISKYIPLEYFRSLIMRIQSLNKNIIVSQSKYNGLLLEELGFRKEYLFDEELNRKIVIWKKYKPKKNIKERFLILWKRIEYLFARRESIYVCEGEFNKRDSTHNFLSLKELGFCHYIPSKKGVEKEFWISIQKNLETNKYQVNKKLNVKLPVGLFNNFTEAEIRDFHKSSSNAELFLMVMNSSTMQDFNRSYLKLLYESNSLGKSITFARKVCKKYSKKNPYRFKECNHREPKKSPFCNVGSVNVRGV